MPERYEFAFFEGGVDVHTDESGNRHVKRGALRRIMWMGFGLFFGGLIAFLLLVEPGPMTILFWGGAVLAIAGGVLAEPILGGSRSDVKETEEGVFVELIPVTRGMAAAGTLMAAWMGLSLVFALVDPSGAAQYSRTKGWILVLADVIPFGELILGTIFLLISGGLFFVTRSGYTQIEPAEDDPE